MKVAHIITRLIVGGAQENTLYNVEDQHALHGDQVALITGPGLGPEGSLQRRAEAGGFPLFVIPELRRSLHPWRDWRAFQRMLQVLQEYQPVLVHTHSSKAGILGRMAAAKLGIPAVHTIHGAAFHYGQSLIARKLYQTAERWVSSHTARYISVADAMTHEYVRARIAPADRFVTIYSGFDVEPFLHPPTSVEATRTALGLEPQHLVVGKIARLFHLKGHEFLIRAAPRIIQTVPEARFLLVGDGVLRSGIERELIRLRIREHFVFTGLVPPEQIPELIHAMDVVVHTSQWEGLARVLPQALIAGKPVVSYDVGGAREVVLDGVTGFLLPRDSVEPLAEAVIRLACDASLRTRLGHEGRLRFTHQFRHQTMTERIRAIYQDVLDRSPQPGSERD